MGDLLNASPEQTVEVQGQATAVTPTPSGPPDTLLNLSLTANVDLRSSISRTVQGEVAIS